MSTNTSLLPKEAVALVQHIELNKAGWWDKAVQRLVLASVWLAAEPPDIDAIRSALVTSFRLSLSVPKLTSALASLESRQMLLRLPNDAYRIPEEQRLIFEDEIAASEKAEAEAKSLFCKLVVQTGDGLETERVWLAFEDEFLAPLIKQVGANAYRLVSGERMTVDKELVDHFLEPFSPQFHDKLRALVTTFLDPKRPEVRAHISRLLHARFCVEASGLPEDVLAKLNASVGKPIRFQMFVDTNFLFSLLELHENPSNAAAQELRELIAQLKGNPRIQLVITPETIEEAKSSISYTKGQLSGLPAGRNFTEAALQGRFSGMAIRFLTERLRRNGRLTTQEWFDPYLSDFVPMARSKGVELFNEKLDGYSIRQDVIDDIHDVFKFEEGLPENRRKSYPKVAHDMVLWHFVNEKRPAYVESPIDAHCWILTVDFRFIGFDEHKQKALQTKIPLCIHPASLIQLLQFWVPRTKEFEEAMLGSLRLPFLFQDFDIESEKTSLKILKGIGRFDGSEGLSQDTITHVMFNDGLRSRLQTEHSDENEIAFIRDALVEEMKLRTELEAAKAKHLDELLKKRETKLVALDAETKNKDQAIEQLKGRVTDEESKARQAAAQLYAQGKEIEALKARWDEQNEKRITRRAYLYYLPSLIFIILVSYGAALGVEKLPASKWIAGFPLRLLAGSLAFIVLHLILEMVVGRNSRMNSLWPFQQIARFRAWLWTVVVVGVIVGTAGSLQANRVQTALDEKPAISSQVPLNGVQKTLHQQSISTPQPPTPEK